MMSSIRLHAPGSVPALLGAALVAACGGDGGPTSPPPGPPPPPPPPTLGASLDLAPGEMRVLTDAASIRAFELVGADGAREYQVIVMSAGQTVDGLTPIQLRAESGASANVVPVRPRTGLGLAGSAAADLPRPGGARVRSDARHLELQAMALEELRRVGARPARPARRGAHGPSARASVASARVPSVNDPITIKSAVTPGGGLSCSLNTPIDGVVKTVGQNFVIVED
ncbi:MAG: hypothetical protein MJB57_13465, partial [Gemmatimonadetes bacterium]|nr:hypothetical protein [Gemmatimonadota bacterium]